MRTNWQHTDTDSLERTEVPDGEPMPIDRDLSGERPRPVRSGRTASLGRVIDRRIALLTRVRDIGAQERTLYFSFEGALKSERASVSMISPEHMPSDFDGDCGWFEIEKVSSLPWPYWRASRQVEGPA